MGRKVNIHDLYMTTKNVCFPKQERLEKVYEIMLSKNSVK